MALPYRIRRRVFLLTVLFVLLAALFLITHNPFPTDPAEIRHIAEIVGKRHGVVIGYGSPKTFFVPPFPLEEDCGEILPVDIENMGPVLAAVERELPLYPSGFFARFCKGIFFCGGIKNGTESAAGTYGKAWIIIAAQNEGFASDRHSHARGTVHHEFSSFIWLYHPFIQKVWAETLPKGWKPAANIVEALKAGKRSEVAPSSGFLSDYGATCAENDFNVYAETIFTDPERILKLAAQYPIIAQKTAMFMNAYISVEPRMEQVFAKLKLLHLRSSLDGSGNIVIKATSPVEMPQGEAISLPNH